MSNPAVWCAAMAAGTFVVAIAATAAAVAVAAALDTTPDRHAADRAAYRRQRGSR